MYKEDIECGCFCVLDWVHVGTLCKHNVKDLCEYVCNVLILHPAGHGTAPKDVFIMMVKRSSP